MYDPVQLLANIDHNKWSILIGFSIGGLIFQWIWLIECIRMAKRERVYSMPLFLTFFWFAHDSGCVIRAYEWFVVYDHWFLKLYWFGLLTAVIIELIFFGQVIKYGRNELAPGLSKQQLIAGLIVFQVFATVAWEWFKYAMDDPLYLASPATTMISYPVFGAALMLRRRSTIGQNSVMYLAFTGMTVMWFGTTYLWYGEPFRSWQFVVCGTLAAIGGLVMAYLTNSRSRWFPRTPLAHADPSLSPGTEPPRATANSH